MESTSNVSSIGDVPARLSPAQKRDLLGQTVAAVITTALIAVPLISPPPGSMAVSSETMLPAQSFAGTVTAVAVRDVSPARALPRRARSSVSARIRAEGPLMARAVAPTGMVPAVGTSGSLGVSAGAPERGDARKPLSRKLTGWLTGDGTVSVRPFPTVAARQ